MKTYIYILFTFVFGVVLSGESRAQSQERTVQDTLAFQGETVSVENKQGHISISSWNRDAVAYEARIASEQSASAVEQTAIEADEFHGRLSFRTNFDDVQPEWSFGPRIFGYGVAYPTVEYRILVPSGVSVTIEDEESDIAATDLSGSLRVESDEGDVSVERHTGTLWIDVEDGLITVSDVQGDVKVDMYEGALTAMSVNGRFFYEAVEGQADVAFDSLATTTIENREGSIELAIPSDTGFELSTDLGDDVQLQGDYDLEAIRDAEGNYSGGVMGGGPLVRIEVPEGSATLRRR